MPVIELDRVPKKREFIYRGSTKGMSLSERTKAIQLRYNFSASSHALSSVFSASAFLSISSLTEKNIQYMLIVELKKLCGAYRCMKFFSEINSVLQHHLNRLKKEFHVAEIGVFGSSVRGEQKADSDIDILVEFSRPVGFFSCNWKRTWQQYLRPKSILFLERL